MPRIDFDEKNRAAAPGDYPKLKLDKNACARILVIEKQPVAEYVHTLRAPRLVNGEPIEELVDKFGTSVKQYAMDFIGRPICLGKQEILSETGIDPENCPVCELASTTTYVDPPQRRFALHVLRYSTLPGGWDLRTPFSVELLVWSFTERIYNKLLDISKEWGSLQDHDLKLGPCTNPQFQQFDIQVAGIAEWQADNDRRQLTLETFKSNRVPDSVLVSACGRVSKPSFLADDLTKIKARWAAVDDFKAGADRGPKSLDDGLTGILDEPEPVKAKEPVPVKPDDPLAVDDLEALLG